MDAKEEFEKVVEYLRGNFQTATEVHQGENFETRNLWVRFYKKDGYHFRVEMTDEVLSDYGAPFVIKQLEHWGPDPKEPCAVVVTRDGLKAIDF